MARPKDQTRNKGGSAERGDTFTRILDVAEEVFGRYGYLGARLDDIAEAVGIRRPSLFHHFRNKEALYLAVLNRWLERQADFFAEAVGRKPNPDPEMELELLVDATVTFLVDNPSFSYLALHTLAANQAEGVPTEVSTVSLDHWQQLLERGRETGVFGSASVAECMALIGGITTFYVAMPDSQTGMLSAIRDVERERLRDVVQRLTKALLLHTGR